MLLTNLGLLQQSQQAPQHILATMSTNKKDASRVSGNYPLDKEGIDKRHENGYVTIIKAGSKLVAEACWTQAQDVNGHYNRCDKCTGLNRLQNKYAAMGSEYFLNPHTFRRIVEESDDGGGAILPIALLFNQDKEWMPDDEIEPHPSVPDNKNADWKGMTFLEVMEKHETQEDRAAVQAERDVRASIARRHVTNHKRYVQDLAKKCKDPLYDETLANATKAVATKVAHKSDSFVRHMVPSVAKLVKNDEESAELLFSDESFSSVSKKRACEEFAKDPNKLAIMVYEDERLAKAVCRVVLDLVLSTKAVGEKECDSIEQNFIKEAAKRRKTT
jgi:hypothetical protein